MRKKISIWKAPKLALAPLQATTGFQPKDFEGTFGENPDGRAYFSKNRKLAQAYSECYRGGIIEVQLYRDDYRGHFERFEEICLGSGEIQIAIPRDFLIALNTMTIRRIWHHG